MGFGVAGRFDERLLEKSARFGKTSGLQHDHAEIVERALVPWINLERSAIKRFRRFGIVLSQAKIAERKNGFGIVGDVSVSEGEFLFSQRQVIRFQCLPARVVSIERPQ